MNIKYKLANARCICNDVGGGYSGSIDRNDGGGSGAITPSHAMHRRKYFYKKNHNHHHNKIINVTIMTCIVRRIAWQFCKTYCSLYCGEMHALHCIAVNKMISLDLKRQKAYLQ